jgi:hypothetical protein
MTSTQSQPKLSPQESQYLAQLQATIDGLREALREHDRVTALTTNQLTRENLNTARGYFISQIEAWRLEWIRYAVLDSRDEWKRALLNTEVARNG